ncbi:SPOR domain-containing protein [Oceanobacillus caeni]|uniref:SPOR domain-containing protein n=1 Tax=Oceanobacillus caeni TaxID=405946 RepID=UPI00214A3473|nr:SPOR domain-containing protein [Oceanobacillus caeni]MCR1833965.1 SPOR domain-containing protein [Oceanobacillus caeni]
MDKKKQIIIKENGKVIKQYPKQNINSSKRESAATLHESDDDPIKTFERKSVLTEATPHKKTSKNPLLKSILTAVVSAILIGGILSVIMFQVLIDVKDGINNQDSSSVPSATQADNDKEKTNEDNSANTAETSNFTLESLHGFVLQAGVFSEKKNAENWAKNFSNSGLPVMIWNRDGQYFLLLGIAETKAQAESIVSQLDDKHDLYIKEWETKQGNVGLTKDEQEWLLAFQQKWEDNVKQSYNISKDNWAELPKVNSSDKLEPLVNRIEQLKSDSGLKGQKYLLDLMFEYEKVINKAGS